MANPLAYVQKRIGYLNSNLVLLGVQPVNGTIIDTAADIQRVFFSRPVNDTTITQANFTLSGAGVTGSPVNAASVTYTVTEKTENAPVLSFTPALLDAGGLDSVVLTVLDGAAGVLDNSGGQLDTTNVSNQFKYTPDTAGVIPEPAFQILVTEGSLPNTRKTILAAGSTAKTIVLDAIRKLQARVLCDNPGANPPTATLHKPGGATVDLTFNGLISDELTQATELDLYGEYYITFDAYTDGSSNTIGPTDYYFVVPNLSLSTAYNQALEGWGYFPREEGLPAVCPEAGSFLAPDGINNVPAWDAGTTTATVTAGSGNPLAITKNTAALRHYHRLYDGYCLKNNATAGFAWDAPAYIEAAISVTGTAGAVSTAFTATAADPPVYTAAPALTTTSTGIRLRNGPYLAELVLLNLAGGNVTLGLRVHHPNPQARAYILGPTVPSNTPTIIRLEKTEDATPDPAYKVYVGGSGTAAITVKEKYLPRVFADDHPVACEAGFGVFEDYSQNVTATFEYVRYAFYDEIYIPGSGAPASSIDIGFSSLHRSTDAGSFFRSPCIKLDGNDNVDPLMADGQNVLVTAVLTYEADGSLVAKNIPVKVRFCLADFDDANDRSIAGFITHSTFPQYNSGNITPLAASGASTAALTINAVAATTQYTAETVSCTWQVSVDLNSLTRRLFILAYLDSPLLKWNLAWGAPRLLGAASADGAAGYFDTQENASFVRTGDTRGVIRQFLPDFYFRDDPNDTDPVNVGLMGGWLTPDVTLAVFQGPTSNAHADPDPQTQGETLYTGVTEASYPLGFARSFQNDVYLDYNFSNMNAYDIDADTQSTLSVSDTGWTDYAANPVYQCYYNRLWARISNRGIVPGPANVQLFFLDSTLWSSFGVDAGRPNPTGTAPNRVFNVYWMWADKQDTTNTADIAGTKVVQTVFQRFTKRSGTPEVLGDETSAQYDIDNVGAVPALSGWSTPGAVKKFIIAEFIWHVGANEIVNDIHGCRAICINLPDPVPETGNEVSTSGVDTAPPPNPNVWTYNQQTNNVAIRNSNITFGLAPPPPSDVNLKSAIDNNGAPVNHSQLPNKFAVGFGNFNALLGIVVDARKFPKAELILRVREEIARYAQPKGFVEFFPEIVMQMQTIQNTDTKKKDRKKGEKLPYKYYVLEGGKIGYLDGILKEQMQEWLKRLKKRGSKLKKPDESLLSDISLYLRPSPYTKEGIYDVTIMQTINKKPAGGYRTVIVMPKKWGIRFIADKRTKAIYDLRKYPQAAAAIPYGYSTYFAGAGFAFQEGFRFSPLKSIDFFRGKLKNERVNTVKGYKRPSLPKKVPLLPGGLEGAVIGSIVDAKGQGIAGISVFINDCKSKNVLGTGITDLAGRYLITIPFKEGKTISVRNVKRRRKIEIILKLRGNKTKIKPFFCYKVKGLCFAVKTIVLKQGAVRG